MVGLVSDVLNDLECHTRVPVNRGLASPHPPGWRISSPSTHHVRLFESSSSTACSYPYESRIGKEEINAVSGVETGRKRNAVEGLVPHCNVLGIGRRRSSSTHGLGERNARGLEMPHNGGAEPWLGLPIQPDKSVLLQHTNLAMQK